MKERAVSGRIIFDRFRAVVDTHRLCRHIGDYAAASSRGCSYRRGNTVLPYRTTRHRTITWIDRPQ